MRGVVRLVAPRRARSGCRQLAKRACADPRRDRVTPCHGLSRARRERERAPDDERRLSSLSLTERVRALPCTRMFLRAGCSEVLRFALSRSPRCVPPLKVIALDDLADMSPGELAAETGWRPGSVAAAGGETTRAWDGNHRPVDPVQFDRDALAVIGTMEKRGGPHAKARITAWRAARTRAARERRLAVPALRSPARRSPRRPLVTRRRGSPRRARRPVARARDPDPEPPGDRRLPRSRRAR